jgi:hypothetical protein
MSSKAIVHRLMGSLIAMVIVLTASPARSLQSPQLEQGFRAEAARESVGGGYAWEQGALLLYGAGRFDVPALDVRLYAGLRWEAYQGRRYRLHVQGALGPRVAFLDDVGVGAWGELRGRGLWVWPRWMLHTGVFADVATEFVGAPGQRIRPGGDLGVGHRFDRFAVWLNLDAGYSVGGQGAGGLHLGGTLAIQW